MRGAHQVKIKGMDKMVKFEEKREGVKQSLEEWKLESKRIKNRG